MEHLTIPELSERWQLSISHVTRLIENKRLAAMDFSAGSQRSWRILLTDIVEYERSHYRSAEPVANDASQLSRCV